MPDDSEPETQNEFEPDGPSNRGPGKTRVGAADNDDEFVRMLKRAIRKVKRETGTDPTLQRLAELLNLSVPALRHLMENHTAVCASEEGSASLGAYLKKILEEKPYNQSDAEIPANWRADWLKPGQMLKCKVLRPEPGGYAVIIVSINRVGFLPWEAPLKVGAEILAQYVCVHNNRILLSAKLSGSKSDFSELPGPLTHIPSKRELPNWDSILNKSPTVGSRGFPKRRATDLFLPPLDTEQPPNRMRIGQGDDLLWLITDLEGGMRTGCVKASCHPKKSRSAVLLYKGRAVGCVYGNSQMHEAGNTESSLQMMLNDCSTPDAHLVMYGLPDELVLAMSALFLGNPVSRKDDLDARSYMDYILRWCSRKERTACLAFGLPSGETILSFVHSGRFLGTFHVDTQEFSPDIQFVHDQLREQAQARVEASILPSELLTASVPLGYSLSCNMPKF